MNETIDTDSAGNLLNLPFWLWVLMCISTLTFFIYILLSIFSFPFECGKQEADDDDLLCEHWLLSNPPVWAIDSKNKSSRKQRSKCETKSKGVTNANSLQARTAKAPSLPLIERTCPRTLSLNSNSTQVQSKSNSLDQTASTRCETAKTQRATCTSISRDSTQVKK